MPMSIAIAGGFAWRHPEAYLGCYLGVLVPMMLTRKSSGVAKGAREAAKTAKVIGHLSGAEKNRDAAIVVSHLSGGYKMQEIAEYFALHSSSASVVV